ncbi:uncharacterized protein LOC6546809 [Drosophila erecta]|uniref:MD-2-related lipid-recognition domain-containing protein n=1 Tax=Drosophila erecta TaxID=7220 RepID=B3NS17_DROER|nr:uncharacterized protein LOC6546809 [Drosophila erecta]EDV56319.2 uncharacterized protein Dere_GG20297 [Drosophila erecta]
MILILIQVFHYNEAKRRLRWDCFDCQMGPQYTDRMTCQIGGTRRTLLNVELKLLTELDQIKVYIKISTRFKSSTSYRKFFDITFDGCRVISDMDHGTMASNVFNAVVKSSNQPRKCPIKEGSIYYHNISVEDALPMFVPSAQLFIQLDFYSRRQLYLNVSLRGEIIE